MREIKFRVWDKSVPANTSKEELANPSGMMIPWHYVIESTYLLSALRGDYPLMQYTGLKDKNGVEIFEGDIVSYPNRDCSGAVKFGTYEHDTIEQFIAGTGFYFEYSNHVQPLHTSCVQALEILGNIYQHPTLLTPKS